MKKIVIASDSFKGSLDSAGVAEAAAAGVHDVFPECETVKIQVADGGEGMIGALKAVLGGPTDKNGGTDRPATEQRTVILDVHDPIGRRIMAEYLIYNGTAIIEMAQAGGLPLLRKDERNPLMTSTYGIGEMIMDAFRKGCRKFLVGLGGSATNDGGTGMLEALGFRFLDGSGLPVTGCCGGRLHEIRTVDSRQVDPELIDSVFEAACDVDTPFCGPDGATHVFARQKGADDRMIEELEKGMLSWAGVIGRTREGTRNDYSGSLQLDTMPGAGAAGGLGGALAAFMNARLRKGIDIILDTIRFDDIIQGADLVITGEGKIDSQTFKGKVPAGVLARSARQGIPVIAIGGMVDIPDSKGRSGGSSPASPTGTSSAEDFNGGTGFMAVLPIQPRPQTEEELQAAMNPDTAAVNIRRTIAGYLTGRLHPGH